MNTLGLYDTLITNGQLTDGGASRSYDDASLNRDERCWYRNERLWNCDQPEKAGKRGSFAALLRKLLGARERSASTAGVKVSAAQKA